MQGVFCDGRFGSNYYNYFTYFLASLVFFFVLYIYGLSIMTDVICIVYIHYLSVLILDFMNDTRATDPSSQTIHFHHVLHSNGPALQPLVLVPR